MVKTLDTHFGLSLETVQVLILHYFGANESALEIAVDDSCSSRGLSSFADGPALDLILTTGEVMSELESTVANIHHLVNNRASSKGGGSFVSSGAVRGASRGEHLLFVIGRVGDHYATTVGINPLLDSGQPLVLLADVLITADVNQVNNRLGRHEEVLVEILDFLSSPRAFANGNLLANKLSALEKDFSLLLVRLQTLASDHSIQLGDLPSKMLKILLE